MVIITRSMAKKAQLDAAAGSTVLVPEVKAEAESAVLVLEVKAEAGSAVLVPEVKVEAEVGEGEVSDLSSYEITSYDLLSEDPDKVQEYRKNKKIPEWASNAELFAIQLLCMLPAMNDVANIFPRMTPGFELFPGARPRTPEQSDDSENSGARSPTPEQSDDSDNSGARSPTPELSDNGDNLGAED